NYQGPSRNSEGAATYLAILRNLGRVWKGSEVKKVFTEGDEICVIYDFLSETAAPKVPIVEWLKVRDGRITSVRLYFDRVAFKPVADAL
ncbi:MAG: hypothetical protein JNK82_26070, partial [Myxococcaceae bacterium]|nr:hypothetical protein [Myxococcaceae bacterium]